MTDTAPTAAIKPILTLALCGLIAADRDPAGQVRRRAGDRERGVFGV